ncbi:MAG: hypothetical protein J6K88_07065 [Oscillospiraceae bacterium]|nr:hypothetical protein [Oscillospiraceae bacterium]
MKFRLFFLSFFCVIMCGVFFCAAYFVYRNSQSVFSESEHLSVVLEADNGFSLSSDGKTHKISLLPELSSVYENGFISPVIRIVSNAYDLIFRFLGEFFKNFSQSS